MKIKVKVTTHIGSFQPDGYKYLFITVKNEETKPVWIQNVFVNDSLDLPTQIMQKHRPTPFLLPSGNIWETWIGSFEVKHKLDELYGKVYVHARIENKNRAHIITSIKDEHVSPKGAIPNGTW